VPAHLISVDSSDVLEGKLPQVKAAIERMTAFVRSNEPDVLSYDVFFDPTETVMTVVQVHPDSASMETHLEIGQPVFASFTNLIRLRRIDVYGAASDRLIEQLRRKGSALGDASVTVHTRQS
jgi:hypothetical protein